MRTRPENLNFFEDMAKVAGGAIKSMADARAQIKSIVSGFLDDMDIVSREDFERVEAIAKRALQRQAELEERLEALEKGGKKSAGAAKKTPKKPAVKKATAATGKKKK